MRRPPARSRPTGLMALALCASRRRPAHRLAARMPDARPPEMPTRRWRSGSRISRRRSVSRSNAGRIAEAIPPARERLDLLVRLRGKDHWQTGDARRDVETYEHLAAGPARVQDRFAEAQRAIARGEQLYVQGQYARASEAFQEALAIGREILPEGHPSIGESYNNLAETLRDQMKSAEAEAMHRRALAIALKARPEGHPFIASSYNNLALTLEEQGKPAEAEALHRRALAILLKSLPEGHPLIASSYNNLALTLEEQGKPAEAEAMYRRALAIRLKALPEGHPLIANSYNNLATTLRDQGKPAEAEAMHRRALAIRLKALPEGHPYIASTYNNLAASLRDQGKLAEAEAMDRRALAIRLKALPEGHPLIAASYGNLADSLDRQGKTDEALRAWRLAAAADELARSFGPRGLEAAIGIGSPLPRLAAALARAGRPREAWESWERGLARGLTDEVTRRAARPLTAAERDRQAALLGRGQAADERINRLLSVRALTADKEKALDDLRQQASEVRRELLELDRQFQDKYGALASRPATLEEARGALPEGTALLGWIDTRTDHWACLLARSGDPVWIRLAGAGMDGAWTSEEEGLPRSLRAELDPETTRGRAGPLAEALMRQRLDPLKGHLTGIKRLIVVTSPGMDGVPVEVLMAARPDPAWDAITVSYAPSTAMFAYLAGRPVPRDRPATLLAVADPAYPEPKDDAPAPEPPAAGLGLAHVVPDGNADFNGLRAGDVLLSYAGAELKQPGDLKPVAADGGPRRVPVKYWREGIIRDIEVAAGSLGVGIDPRPATAFVQARRESERVLLGMRGGSHARLPGTRREVEALTGLFPDGRATTILGPQACEATMQGLARSGQLKGYRYLHFATHGQSDPRFAYRTALILAPDPDVERRRDGAGDRRDDHGRADRPHLGAGRRPGGPLGLRERPGPRRGERGLPGLLPAAVRPRGAEPGAEPVEGGRRRDGAVDGPVLPQPAGEARGADGPDAQGRGIGRGEALAPRAPAARRWARRWRRCRGVRSSGARR